MYSGMQWKGRNYVPTNTLLESMLSISCIVSVLPDRVLCRWLALLMSHVMHGDVIICLLGNIFTMINIWNRLSYYRQVSNIRGTLVGNKIFDHSDVACRRYSNYIFILDLTPGFTGLGEDNCTTRRETSKFGDLVRLILEILWYYVDLGICQWFV